MTKTPPLSVYQPLVYQPWPDPIRDGEAAYDDFMNEQLHRFEHGYQPSGYAKIPGRYYFFLNQGTVEILDSRKRKREHSPYYREDEHEWFQRLEDNVNAGRNMLTLKGREKGYSYWISQGVLLPEMLLQENNSIFSIYPTVIARHEMKRKFYQGLANAHKDFQISPGTDNALMMEWIDDVQDPVTKKWTKEGLHNILYWGLSENIELSRSGRFKFFVADEIGEIEGVADMITTGEGSMMEGGVKFGIYLFGGTVNNKKAHVRELKKLIKSAEAYDFDVFFVPATKLFTGYVDYSTGKSNQEEAKKYHDEKRAQKKKADDQQAYWDYVQEHPYTLEEALFRFSDSILNVQNINAQLSRVDTNKDLQAQIAKGYLSRNKSGVIEFVVDERGKMLKLLNPLPEKNFLDVGGVDPYYKSTAPNSPSRGAQVIYRRPYSLTELCDVPVFIYYDRPDDIDEFYRNCLLVAEYYKCPQLIEYNSEDIFNYFRKNYGEQYLMRRPKVATGNWAKSINAYGVPPGGYQMNLRDNLLSKFTNSLDRISGVHFKVLLEDMINYGVENTDIADAFGWALVAAEEYDKMKQLVVETKERRTFMPKLTSQRGKLTWRTGPQR